MHPGWPAAHVRPAGRPGGAGREAERAYDLAVPAAAAGWPMIQPDPWSPTRPLHIPVLALRPRDAARALGIGERLLFDLTRRGEVPSARIGRAVVYRVADLDRWLADRAKASTPRPASSAGPEAPASTPMPPEAATGTTQTAERRRP